MKTRTSSSFHGNNTRRNVLTFEDDGGRKEKGLTQSALQVR